MLRCGKDVFCSAAFLRIKWACGTRQARRRAAGSWGTKHPTTAELPAQLQVAGSA